MRDHFFQSILDRRWLVIAITLLLAGLLGYGMPRLEFNNDYRMFFSEDNPQLQAFEQLQNTYTKNDNVLYVIEPEDGRVFTRDTLAAVTELTQQAWQIPYSLRVDSITNYQHTYAEGDDLVVEDLILEKRWTHGLLFRFIAAAARARGSLRSRALLESVARNILDE